MSGGQFLTGTTTFITSKGVYLAGTGNSRQGIMKSTKYYYLNNVIELRKTAYKYD